MTNTVERGSVILLRMYVYMCVCACTRTQILACTHKHACTHIVGVVCVRRVAKKGGTVSKITILPACPVSEILNLLTDCHGTLCERCAV